MVLKKIGCFFVASAHRGRVPQDGQGLVEYALIILLMALVALGAMQLFGVKLSETFDFIANIIPSP